MDHLSHIERSKILLLDKIRKEEGGLFCAHVLGLMLEAFRLPLKSSAGEMMILTRGLMSALTSHSLYSAA